MPQLSYWCDSSKRKIDVLVERGSAISWAIEAKASSTYHPKFFRHLDTVAEELGVPIDRRVVAYAGQETFETSHGLVCSLKDLAGVLV
jgi:putative aminopeptidase FrvX